MSLTRKDIAEKINTEIGLQKNESLKIVDCILEIMKDELVSGNPIRISGFGQWNVLNKQARRGRNPQTGKAMTVAARKVG